MTSPSNTRPDGMGFEPDARPREAGRAGEVLGEGSTPILVGRDGELGVLRDVLPDVLGGAARVVALSGPAGIGKSRLAWQGLRLADEHGFRVLSGSGAVLQQDLAYAPVVEALRPLVHHAELVDGLPDLGRLFGGLSLPVTPGLGDPGLERTRLFESVRRLLERAATGQPLVLLLDDVHWADRGSLALLQYLVRGLSDQPLLVLLTYRDDETSPSLTGLLTDFRRAGTLSELPLVGLPETAVAALAADLLGGATPAGLLEMLAGRSGGVPLFVRALVDSLTESGALRHERGRWTLTPRPPETVPAAVSELLGSRIERLSDEARAVLELIAVGSGQSEHALLRWLLPEAGLLAGVAELRRAQMVSEEVLDGTVCYRVTHPLLAEVAYALLPLVARRRRHAEVAGAVRAHLPGRLGLLAQHVRHAADEIDPDEALRVLRRAADEALTRKGGDEALTHLGAARTLAEGLNRSDLLPELLDRTAEAYELVGRREQAVAAWLAAAETGGDPDERAGRLQRAAQLEVEAGRYEHTERLIAEASAYLVRVPPGRVNALLAANRLHAAFRWERVDEIAEATAQLEALARQLDLPEAWQGVHSGRWHAAFARGQYAESRVHLVSLLEVAGTSDEFGERARRLTFTAELAWGDLPAATRTAREALEFAERTGVPSLRRSPVTSLGFAAFFAGEWAETLRRAEEVLQLFHRDLSVRAETAGLALRGMVLARRGSSEQALEHAEAARAAAHHAGLADRHVFAPIELVEALAALAAGDPETAQTVMTRSLRAVSTMPAQAATILAQAQLASGRSVAAAATADDLAALGPGAPYPGAVAAWVRGRIREDPDLLGRATDQLATLGFVHEATEARLDLAELVADTPIDECLPVLERLGAQPLVDRARRLLRRHGRRSAPPRRRPGPLSAREQQVARLVAQGLSNPEIAARLYLSTRTVTTHLQNVYGRLGLGSRAALIRYVLEELPRDPPPDT